MQKNLLIGFLPWILYFIFVGPSRIEMDVAIVVGLVSFILTGLASLKEKFILSWTSLIFFLFMFVMVVVRNDHWVAEHAIFISNAMLALVTWGSFLAGVPFTIQYAKQQVPASKWNHPTFIYVNQLLTAAWGVAFTFGVITYYVQSHLAYQLLQMIPLIAAIVLTIYFPNWYRFKKMQEFTANSPFLKDNFAPVLDELEITNLGVTGEIPPDLAGVYMRNGPNPAFPPLSYTYPFDGDGMIHAVYISDGKAHYRNRFVETKGLQAERRAKKAIYGGILNPVIPDAKLIGKEGDQGPFKNGAFIHIIHHGTKFLAMWEGGPAYEMDVTLNTLGEWRPGTELPINVGPHTRLDPTTGERWFINYDIKPPYLTAYCINTQGTIAKQIAITKPYPTMMHDFVMTKNYLVFFDCPIVIDAEALQKGGSPIQWRPDLNTRIGLMTRETAEIKWLTTDAFFVFHFANAYEIEDEIIIDYIRHPEFKWLGDTKESATPFLARTKINLKTQEISHETLLTQIVEFPRIREDKDTQMHRFIYMPAKIEKVNQFHALIKYDTESKTTSIHDFGVNSEIGEAVFAPRKNSLEEDDGYLMLFVYHKETNSSDFVILDAKNISAEPLAVVTLPRRVPHGLHGSWIATTVTE